LQVVQERQNLLIDGDDTLWENNVYFEDGVEDFIDFLDHSRLSRPQVREVIDDVGAAQRRWGSHPPRLVPQPVLKALPHARLRYAQPGPGLEGLTSAPGDS
jgi:hypothetical protein